MEITIRITSAEDAAEAQKVFAALAGETILSETAPKAVPKKAPKKAPNKKAEIADTEKVEVSTKQGEATENLSEIYKELQGAISLLPNGKNNKKLKQFIVREFNLPNVGRLEEVHYSKVIEYANSLLDNAESKQKTDETAIEESPERKVTKAELEKTVYNLVNAGKREELRKTLDELGVAKISSLEESEYTKAMEALEAL